MASKGTTYTRREFVELGATAGAVLLTTSACGSTGGSQSDEGAALINWNKPNQVERLTGHGEAGLLPQKYVDKIKAIARGRDMSGRTAMLEGYTLPDGWDKATKGVKTLVATNGGGTNHDPATILGGILFEEMTGIQIKWRPLAQGAQTQKATTIMTAQSGSIPSLYVSSSYLEAPTYVERGWLPQQDEIWKPSAVRDLYLDGISSIFKGDDGHYYGTPGVATHCFFLFYRPSWLEGAGVDVPKTWQDLVQASGKIAAWAKKNVGPQAAGLSIPAKDPQSTSSLWAHPTYAKGKNLIENGRARIDPEVWELLVSLWTDGGMTEAAFSQSWSDVPAAFGQGNLGFAVAYDINVDLFTDPSFAGKIQGDWAVAALPAWEGVGIRGRGIFTVDAWLVNTFSTPQEIAATMLWNDLYRSYPCAFNELVFEGNQTMMKQVADDPAAKHSPLLQHPEVERESLQNARIESMPAGMLEAIKAFKANLSRAALEGMDLVEARKKAQAEIDEILAS